MAQRTKKEIVFGHIHIAHLALELIKAKTEETHEENELRLENIITKVREIRQTLDKLVVEM